MLGVDMLSNRMRYLDYEIRPYLPDDISEVSEVQKCLYGLEKEITARYFKWKYEENPNAEEPLGFVAVYKNRIVGFRGYFATKWRIGGSDSFVKMLSSSDVCVASEHRRKGLFQAMTHLSLTVCEEKGYGGFINLTSNQYSTGCDIKLGWLNIAERKAIRKCSLIALTKYLLIQKLPLGRDAFNKLGKYGDIEITEQLRVEEMYSVIKEQVFEENKIRLYKDIEFLEWKYRNNLRKYIFCYYWQGDMITGYVVLGIRRYTPRVTNKADIIDYGQTDESSVEKLLSFISKKFSTNIIDLWNYGPELEFASALKKLQFCQNHFTVRHQERRHGKKYLLVRPIKKDYKEQDWFINNFDIRDSKKWEIKEICADDS